MISAIITIIDAIRKVFEASKDAQGLPKAFREVANRLPLVKNILEAAKQHIEGRNADEDSFTDARGLVETCEKKAKKLERIFNKVIPAEAASRAEVYFAAARTIGDGKRVETLMKDILVDVQLLGINHGMFDVSDKQKKELGKAITEVTNLPPSIPEDSIDGPRFGTTHHCGSGSIHQVYGNQYNNTGSGYTYHAQSMSFGTNGKN